MEKDSNFLLTGASGTHPTKKTRLVDTPKGVLSFAKYSRRTIQIINQILMNKPRLIDKPLSVIRRVCRSTTPNMTVISLGRTLPSDSCSLPETHKKTSRFPPPEGEIGLCLALLQPGVAWPLHYCRRRWSLTPPFHPYLLRGGLFLWPDPAGFPAPGVTRRFALWRADFPRSPKAPRPSDQPGL